jgi:hypothetical protein
MRPSLWAVALVTPGRLEQVLVKGLAVLGGAALGGLLAGLLVQLVVRLTTTKSMPRLPLQIIRVLGAIAAGFVVYLFLFGPGGGGFGGPGGWGLGGGNGGNGTATGRSTEQGPSTDRAASTGKSEPPSDTAKSRPTEGSTVRVELLSGGRVRGERWYRVEGRAEPLTLAELRDALRAQLKATPPLEKIVIVIYKDSPDVSTFPVRELKELAADLRLTPVIELPGRDAP